RAISDFFPFLKRRNGRFGSTFKIKIWLCFCSQKGFCGFLKLIRRHEIGGRENPKCQHHAENET
ncbi:unnamed protein product, partial [Larinioides sclopetarius]